MKKLIIFLLLLPSVLGVTNLQHTVDGTNVVITYDGQPPFAINIRDDQNIGQPGGFVVATTHQNSFSIDLSFVQNTHRFFYAVKDTTWSDIQEFTLTPQCQVGDLEIPTSAVFDEEGDALSYIDIVQAQVQQHGKSLSVLMMLNAVVPLYGQSYIWDLVTEQGNYKLEISDSDVVSSESWMVSIYSKGEIIYKQAAVQFGNKIGARVPLEVLHNPKSISWNAEATHGIHTDSVNGDTFTIQKKDVMIHLKVAAPNFLSSSAYFNDLREDGRISVEATDGEDLKLVSTVPSRLWQVGDTVFEASEPGYALVYGLVSDCLLLDPAVIANGKYLLE